MKADGQREAFAGAHTLQPRHGSYHMSEGVREVMPTRTNSYGNLKQKAKKLKLRCVAIIEFFSCDDLFPPAAALFGANLRPFGGFMLPAIAASCKQDNAIACSGDNSNVDNGNDESNDDDNKL
uniref:Uncharacterized protein n=1 Tax=Glossina palpalis gambiensis TaxID=67801 RepID=A0A1B0AS00_9MUSC